MNLPPSLTATHSAREITGYEPSTHRIVLRPTNYCETLVHLIKASIGTGILAMPYGFSKSGYLLGIFGTIIIGFLCTYCLRTMVVVQYELCKRKMKPSMTYSETAKAAMLEGPQCCRAFDSSMSFIANVTIIFFQLGASCIYLVFVATNVQSVIENVSDSHIELYLYMSAVTGVSLITAIISNLKVLAILSFAANISTLASFTILAGYVASGNPTFENRTRIGEWKNIPLFIGTVVFSMESIGSVMPLENEMANPLQFTSVFGVLHVAMFPTVALYVVVGLLGYLNYGEDIKGSITLNLPQKEIMAIICKLLMVFGIFCTSVLAVFIAFEIIWKSCFEQFWKEKLGNFVKFMCQYLIRVTLILVCFGFAILVPNLELLISLIGSLCLASSGIVFPALFNLFTYWEDYAGIGFMCFFVWCVCVMIIGCIICVIGVSISLHHICVHEWDDVHR